MIFFNFCCQAVAVCRVPAIDCLRASRAFKQDMLNKLSIQIVCDHILSNVYRFHYMCPQQMYFQQCVSIYCTSFKSVFPGIVHLDSRTICHFQQWRPSQEFSTFSLQQIFATNICQISDFTQKFCTKCLKKLKSFLG